MPPRYPWYSNTEAPQYPTPPKPSARTPSVAPSNPSASTSSFFGNSIRIDLFGDLGSHFSYPSTSCWSYYTDSATASFRAPSTASSTRTLSTYAPSIASTTSSQTQISSYYTASSPYTPNPAQAQAQAQKLATLFTQHVPPSSWLRNPAFIATQPPPPGFPAHVIQVPAYGPPTYVLTTRPEQYLQLVPVW